MTSATDIGDRFLRLSEVVTKVGLGKTSIAVLQHRGEFPKAVKLTGKAIGFRLSEIEAWMQSRPTA